MALKIHKASPYKTRLLSTLIMVFALLVQPLVALNIPSAFAATTPTISPTSHVVVGGSTATSNVSGVGFQNMKVTFDYDAEPLDAGETMVFGISGDASTNQTITGVTGNDSSEKSSAQIIVPASFNNSNFTVYFTNNRNTPSASDRVDITDLIVTGDEISVTEPVLEAQDFATWDNMPSFKGFSVGFSSHNFGNITSVTLDVLRADGSHVVRTAGPDTLALLSNQTTPTNASAPFVVQPGTSDGLTGSSWWSAQTNLPWTDATMPVSVTITVVGENGTKSVTNSTFLEDDPAHPSYLSMLPVSPTLSFVANYIGNSQYHGISLEISTPNMTDATDVEITVERTNGNPDVWVSNPANTNVTDGLNGPSHDVTAPIVIVEGTRTRTSSTSWLTSSDPWTNDQEPQSITVRVNRAGGLFLEETISLIGSPWGTTWSDIVSQLPEPPVVDTIKPTISINPTIPRAVSGEVSVDVTISDDQPLDENKNKQIWVEVYGRYDQTKKKGQKVSLSSGSGTFTFDSTTLPDGDYILRVGSVEDAAGNKSGDKTFKYVTIDNSAPESASFITPIPGDIVNGATTIEVSIADSGAGLGQQQIVMRRPDNSIAGNWTYNVASGASHTIAGLVPTFTYIGDSSSGNLKITFNTNNLPGDGLYNLRLFTKDALGNGRSNINSSFIVDNTKPVVTITNPTHNSVHNSNVALRATVTDENPHHYWLQIKKNGSVVNIPGVTGTINTTESFTNKLLTTLTESGNYEVTIAARDAAGSGSDTGNRSSDVVVKFVIDKSIPTIDISNVAISTDKKLSFDLVANDTVSGLKVVAANIYDAANVNKLIELGSGNPTRLNEPHEGLPFGTLTFSKSLSGIDVSGLASGTYTIRAYALDHAGNKLEYKTVQFAVDNTPPEKVTGLSAHNADGEITDGVARLFNVTIKWNAVADAEKYEYCYWNDIAGNIYNEENCYTVFPTGNQQSGEFNQGEGLHHIKVRAIDAAGNKGPWSDTFDIFYLENDAVVNGENFNTHSGDDYKGFNIGFNIDYFSEVTGVTVELFDGDTPMVANAHNQKLLDLININGTKQLSTPFITIAGSYVEEYWDLGLYDWASDSPRPTKAVVTVTGKNNIGQDVTRIAILEDLSEPNDWTFESILPEDESKIDEGSKTPAKENSNSLNGRNENSNPQGGENQNQDSTPFFANFAPFANIFQQPLTPPADSTPAETDGNDSTNTGGSGILGDQDEDGTPLTDTGDVKGAMDSKFMGLSLYWWLALIVGFIISLWLIFAALMRRRSQNEA